MIQKLETRTVGLKPTKIVNVDNVSVLYYYIGRPIFALKIMHVFFFFFFFFIGTWQ